MLKNILKIIAVFFLGAIGGIFADQILWPYFIERPLFYKYRLEQAPVYVTERKEIVIQENTALQNAFDKVEKSVAGVRTTTKAGKTIDGSGLVVTSDGLVVTLADLVPKGESYAFFLNGASPSYQILKRDLENNLALVKMDLNRIPTAGFVDLGKLRPGQRVFSVGVAFEENDPYKIIEEGIIRAINENSINTSITAGSVIKGSALFDIEGNVMGIYTVGSGGKASVISIEKIKEFVGF